MLSFFNHEEIETNLESTLDVSLGIGKCLSLLQDDRPSYLRSMVSDQMLQTSGYDQLVPIH